MQAQSQTRNRILLVLFLGVLMGALDIAIVGPALPAIRNTFGVDDRAISWIFNIYVFFSLLGSPLMAKLSDRFNRRSIYLLDIILFAVGSLIVAVSPNFWVLLIGRSIQGLGSGGIFPVASAVIGDSFPEEKRGSALGLIGAVFGIAFIIGPVVGGVFLLWSWHWLFLINLPVAILVIFLGAKVIPATQSQSSMVFDYVGIFFLTIMLGGFTFGLSQIDTTDIVTSLGTVQVWPFLVIGVIALPIFIKIEKRATDPIIRPSLFGTKQLVMGNALSVGAGLGEGALVFLPAMAVAAFTVDLSTASFLTIPVVIAMSFGSPMAGRYLDKWGSKTVILIGTITMTIGMFTLGIEGSQMWAYIAGAMVVGFGLGGLLGAPVRYIMLSEATLKDRAAAQGMITVSGGVGQLLSGALVGAIADSQNGGAGGYTLAYLFVGFVSIALVLMAFGLKNRAQELATTAITNKPKEEFASK